MQMPQQVIVGDVTAPQTFNFEKKKVKALKANLMAGLSELEADALAEFLKRVGFSDFRSLAKSDDEAYLMQSAAAKVAKELAEAGFNPR